MEAVDATTRIAVSARRAASTTGDGAQHLGCVVGAAGSRRVVWIRGGVRHEPIEDEGKASLRAPSDELMDTPRGLSDDVAVLCDDAAVAIAAAKAVLDLQADRVAVVTTVKTRTIASFLVKYLDQREESAPNQHLMPAIVVSTDEIKAASTISQGSGVKDQGKPRFDCCVDLACNESSLTYATSHLEPLGSIVLLSGERVKEEAESTTKTIPIDMNTVVVNELSVRFVAEYTTEGPTALAFLASALREDITM